MSRVRDWVDDHLGGLIILIIILVSVIVCWGLASSYYHVHETDITIERMYIDHSGDESFYMIATTDGRVFEADNCWVKGQNAIDTEWAYLQVNQTYHVKYVGWDIHNPLMDEYYVIYHFEEEME